MNVKPDHETLTALARFTRSAEWEVIEKWLVQRREGWVQTSFSADNAKSRQAQGAVLEIDSFLQIARAAESSVSR